MLHLVALAKVAGSLVAIGAAVLAAATGAQAGFHTGTASLSAHAVGCSSSGSECRNLFAGGAPLYPGSAPLVREVEVTYTAPSASSSAGLYIPHPVSQAGRSGATCTAADPASMVNLMVTGSGTILYRGTLSAFATAHADPLTLLPLNAGHLTPGSTITITLSISMDRAADNSYMGCAIDTDFAWYAAA